MVKESDMQIIKDNHRIGANRSDGAPGFYKFQERGPGVRLELLRFDLKTLLIL